MSEPAPAHPEPGFLHWGNVAMQEGIPDWWRMHLIPRNRWFNLYLHRYGPGFRDGRMWGLHDHPGPSVSFLLRGALREIYHPIRDGRVVTDQRIERQVPRLCYRPAHWSHALTADSAGATYTLFIMGGIRRDWGFWRPTRNGRHEWISHDEARASERALDLVPRG